jgi:hypothetical protein
MTDLMTFMSWSYLYFVFKFYCPHDWSYDFYESIVFIFRTYISLSSWLIYDFHEWIVFTLIVFMIYFNPSSSYLVVLVI